MQFQKGRDKVAEAVKKLVLTSVEIGTINVWCGDAIKRECVSTWITNSNTCQLERISSRSWFLEAQ